MQSLNKLSAIGKMIILESLILFVPLLLLVFYPSECSVSINFLLPGIVSILIGLMIGIIGPKKLSSSRLVVFSWFYGFLLAAIPFYLLGGLTVVQALFESVSGFTTTGLSVLDVEKLPKIFLFYRAFLQYVGGLGFVFMMILFVEEKDSATLYQAEGHPDKLMPTIGKTAKTIVLIYLFFLLAGTIMYLLAGMDLLDALVHTMCALSTGGFSNRLASIASYDSFAIELVTIILMMVGITNFALLLSLIKGQIKIYLNSSETRFLFGILLVAIIGISFFLRSGGFELIYSLRLALFNAVSAVSTTGFATCDYALWPDEAVVIMILLMMIGGGIGSTAGGIKLGRICRLLKNLMHHIKKMLIPDRTVTLTYYSNGRERELLSREDVEEASTYASVYLLIFILGSIALTYFANTNYLFGAFEFASSIGTAGFSIGITNINTSGICLLIEIAGMILGRLEIFVLLKIFIKS